MSITANLDRILDVRIMEVSVYVDDQTAAHYRFEWEVDSANVSVERHDGREIVVPFVHAANRGYEKACVDMARSLYLETDERAWYPGVSA